MSAVARGVAPIGLDLFLRLGRVSNLPTVWTNALAGVVLSGVFFGGTVSVGLFLLICLALSLFYLGGMWLNDAFDAEIDARERASRPIPMGEISRRAVFIGGGAMLAVALGIGIFVGGGVAAVCLTAAILLYDWRHKHTVLSPVIMGAARFFSYIFAASAAAGTGLDLSGPVIWGALGLFAYVVGLTYAAKQEAYDRIDRAWPVAVLGLPVLVILWHGNLIAFVVLAGLLAVLGFALMRLFRRQKGDVPVAVVTLIAGISVYDAALIAAYGGFGLALLAVAGFVATLYLQRIAAGT